MNLISPGLRGKFVAALLIAAVLPLLVGLIFLETLGYRHLLDERGKFHEMQAVTLRRVLDEASKGRGHLFHTWVAADRQLTEFVSTKNRVVAGLSAAEIEAETQHLEEDWAKLAANDPKLLAFLQNPGSVNLKKFQALYPEFAEILVTDRNGRLMAATGKSTDINQADESWWQRGKDLDASAHWIDALRFDASSGVFSQDVILSLRDSGEFEGVVKMSVDVTSLFTHLGFDGEKIGERWEIVLTDGRILASSKKNYVSLSDQLGSGEISMVRKLGNGWATMSDASGQQRMAGFVNLGAGNGSPDSYVLFSSKCADVVAPLRWKVTICGIAGSLLIGLCALAGFHLVDRQILRPLATLGQAARSIAVTAQLRQNEVRTKEQLMESRHQAEEDLERIRSIHTGDEVELLAGDLAEMTARVLRYHKEMEAEVMAKTALITEDLEMARQFQNALLPSVYPEIASIDAGNQLRLKFAHFYQPSSTVGGDFFDLVELDGSRVGVLIADVMGHGARSALVTAILRALVRNHVSVAGEPEKFLAELNKHLHELISRSGQSLFVTAFYIVLDTGKSTASWAVAGHPAPLKVRRGSGKGPEPLWFSALKQPALGLIEDFSYRSFQSPLHAGDVFLLYTDGPVEAENPAGEAFGSARLAASLDEALDGPMAAIPAKIVCDVMFFQKRKSCDDDVCIVAIEACRGYPTDSW